MSPSRFTKILRCTGVIFLIICVVLICIILPLSVISLEYYEFGLLEQRSTGKVDFSRLYKSGWHFTGPDYKFKKIQSTAEVITFDNIGIFTSDNLVVTISANFVYFVREDDAIDLVKDFDVDYRTVLNLNALTAFKNAAPKLSTRDYVYHRKAVEDHFYEAIRAKLSGNCCYTDCHDNGSCVQKCIPRDSCTRDDKGLFVDMPRSLFNLRQVQLAEEIEKQFLDARVLEETTREEEYKREATAIGKETERLVNVISNEASELTAAAKSDALLIAKLAAANATSILQAATGEGLRFTYDVLNITNAEQKKSYYYLTVLRTSKKVHLDIGYQQFVSLNN